MVIALLLFGVNECSVVSGRSMKLGLKTCQKQKLSRTITKWLSLEESVAQWVFLKGVKIMDKKCFGNRPGVLRKPFCSGIVLIY